MRFDQTLKLNETWRELARGPMRDDGADSSLKEHLLALSSARPTSIRLTSMLLGNMPPTQVRFQPNQCPVAAVKLHRPRFESANAYGSTYGSISCSDADMICCVWTPM